jgi:chloride channel 7
MAWIGAKKDEASARLLADVVPSTAEPFLRDFEPSTGSRTKSVAPPAAVVGVGKSKGGKGSHFLESFDFDTWDSLVGHLHTLNVLLGREAEKHNLRSAANPCSYGKRKACLRWVYNFLIAFCTGMVAVLVTFGSRNIIEAKFAAVDSLITSEREGKSATGVAFLVFWAINLACAVGASLLVAFVEPVAGGSGISEVKCILNGVRLPKVTRLKTLVVKALGITLSVSSGLPLGKEGPMVHAGAVVAAGLSQGKSNTLGFSTRWTRLPEFRNDQEKRDFVSCGAAAGVAAAFNAPVGGTLFSLEEGSSFWSQSLTWRAFASAMISSYTISFFLSGFAGNWGKLSTLGMFSFGDFNSTGQNSRSYVIGELFVFILLGIVGGFVGAAFNQFNAFLTKCRHKWLNSPISQVMDVALVCTLTSVCAYSLPLLLGECRDTPASSPYANSVVQFYCNPGQYNDMATFFFAPGEDAIRMLFHFDSHSSGPDDAFGWRGLIVAFVAYATLTCLTYGTAVPSGLFVPSLLSGAALGRLTGMMINSTMGNGTVDPGTYALIGAAGVLGGMARMTISLAVILVEATGDLQYGLPLMLTLLAARWTGNLFNEGLYDLHIHLRHWPLLEEKPHKSVAERLRVCDVMVSPPKTVVEVTRVGEVLALLHSSTHHGFPVVFAAETLAEHPRFGNLAGLINRKHLTTLIANRAFHAVRPPLIYHDPEDKAPPPQELALTRSSEGGKDWEEKRQGATVTKIPAMGKVTPDGLRRHIARSHSVVGAALKSEGRVLLSDEEIEPRSSVQSLGKSHRATSSARLGLVRRERAQSSTAIRPEVVEPANSVGENEDLDGGSSGDDDAESFASLRRRTAQDSRRAKHQADAVFGLDFEGQPLLTWEDMESSYPRYPTLSEARANLEEGDTELWLDLRPYMNPTPFTVHARAPLLRAYRLFRSLGLRHLVVVNDCHDVVGILTRKDLIDSNLRACLQRKSEIHTS